MTKTISLIIVSFLLLTSTFSCMRKLLNPLKDKEISSLSNKLPRGYEGGKTILFYPLNSRNVYSSENCVIDNIVKLPEGYIVIAKGKYTITYSPLSKCNVTQGQNLRAGEMMGTIDDSSDKGEKYLELYVIDKKGKIITDKEIFTVLK
jgi:hypothetical protein